MPAGYEHLYGIKERLERGRRVPFREDEERTIDVNALAGAVVRGELPRDDATFNRFFLAAQRDLPERAFRSGDPGFAGRLATGTSVDLLFTARALAQLSGKEDIENFLFTGESLSEFEGAMDSLREKYWTPLFGSLAGAFVSGTMVWKTTLGLSKIPMIGRYLNSPIRHGLVSGALGSLIIPGSVPERALSGALWFLGDWLFAWQYFRGLGRKAAAEFVAKAKAGPEVAGLLGSGQAPKQLGPGPRLLAPPDPYRTVGRFGRTPDGLKVEAYFDTVHPTIRTNADEMLTSVTNPELAYTTLSRLGKAQTQALSEVSEAASVLAQAEASFTSAAQSAASRIAGTHVGEAITPPALDDVLNAAVTVRKHYLKHFFLYTETGASDIFAPRKLDTLPENIVAYANDTLRSTNSALNGAHSPMLAEAALQLDMQIRLVNAMEPGPIRDMLVSTLDEFSRKVRQATVRVTPRRLTAGATMVTPEAVIESVYLMPMSEIAPVFANTLRRAPKIRELPAVQAAMREVEQAIQTNDIRRLMGAFQRLDVLIAHQSKPALSKAQRGLLEDYGHGSAASLLAALNDRALLVFQNGDEAGARALEKFLTEGKLALWRWDSAGTDLAGLELFNWMRRASAALHTGQAGVRPAVDLVEQARRTRKTLTGTAKPGAQATLPGAELTRGRARSGSPAPAVGAPEIPSQPVLEAVAEHVVDAEVKGLFESVYGALVKLDESELTDDVAKDMIRVLTEAKKDELVAQRWGSEIDQFIERFLR